MSIEFDKNIAEIFTVFLKWFLKWLWSGVWSGFFLKKIHRDFWIPPLSVNGTSRNSPRFEIPPLSVNGFSRNSPRFEIPPLSVNGLFKEFTGIWDFAVIGERLIQGIHRDLGFHNYRWTTYSRNSPRFGIPPLSVNSLFKEFTEILGYRHCRWTAFQGIHRDFGISPLSVNGFFSDFTEISCFTNVGEAYNEETGKYGEFGRHNLFTKFVMSQIFTDKASFWNSRWTAFFLFHRYSRFSKSRWILM